ncbi:MAG: hypothetical protein ACTHN3_12165 [Solirubrobacterales bacterium]
MLLSESRWGPIESGWQRAARAWSQPRIRIAAGVAAFAILTFVTYLIAHPRMFTGFAYYDDEGYMLTALKGFVHRGNLYDDVFTQYGPFYYEAWGGLFSIFGIAVNHDAGRTVTMVVWIVASLGIGLSTWRLTGSLLLGLGTQAIVFAALAVAVNEPMHPGGIITLLLAAIIAVSCFVGDRPSPLPMALLGAAVAALVLVKVNVGAFAVASLALACAVSYPAFFERRWPRILIEAGFVAMPILLLAGKFGEGWPRRYAVHVAVAALGLVVVLRARRNVRRAGEELGWLVGGFVVLAVVSLLTIIAAGTSLHGLVEGVIQQPLRQANAFEIPLQLDSRLYGFDVVALGGALAYWYVGRGRGEDSNPAWIAMTSLFSVAVGLVMALSVIGKGLPFDAGGLPGYEFSMLGFCWVALIGTERRPGLSFPLLLLPLLAVPQALHAYPVAGSQTLWATFLLIPVGAICVGNGVRGLFAVLPAASERRALAVAGACLLVVVGYLVFNSTIREPLRAARSGYDNGVSLALPGAEAIHLGAGEARLYQRITAAIDRNCTATVMLPGMDSFYLWSEEEPPTGSNATAWPTLFDASRQRQVIAEIEPIENICQLRNESLAAGWSNGAIPPGPLVRYLDRGFRSIAKFGAYELLRRQAGGEAS